MDYDDVDDLPEGLAWTALGTSGSIANRYFETGQWEKTTVGGRTWDFAFGATGELLSASSGVASHVRDYDRFKRLDSVRLGGPAIYSTLEELLIIDIAYDGWDRISEVRVSDGTPDPASGSVDSYAYDDASRLVAWRYQEGLSTLRDVSYEHDSAGNIERVVDDGSATTYTYDADNRLVSASDAQTSVTYGNDELGRRTSRTSGGSTTTYGWDATGRLAAVTSEESTVTYSYGATGMLDLTVRESEGETETTEHFWRGSTLTAERFSDGTVHEYVYGPGGLPLELVVRAPGQPAERYSYAVDGGGSVIGLTGDAPGGALLVSYRYDPYGAVEETWAASGYQDLAERNPLRYRSYYYDTATDLYYLPARYYDPDTMRFLSPDPAFPGAGDPLSLNRYAYCVGDPVNHSDPTGEIADWDGNGRVDAHDVSQHAATHTSNSKLKRLYAARAARQYYQSTLSSGGLAPSRAATLASMMVSYALNEAVAWADKKGIREFYVDASWAYSGFGYGGVVGVMGGEVRNYHDGVMTDDHRYGGVTIGPRGVSYSIVVGGGRVEPQCRYIELAGGAKLGGAIGYRSDNDRSAPWDLAGMGAHVAQTRYSQAGVCQPQFSGSLSWFYVMQ